MRSEIKKLTVLSLFIFLLFSLGGYFHASLNPDIASVIFDELTDRFSFVLSMGPFQLFALIFLNNSVKALVFMLLGIFLGVLPLIFMAFNGYVLGALAFVMREEWASLLLGVLPHGIVEIPAVALASAYGILLGITVIKKRGELKNLFKEALCFYGRVIVPLLAAAALIEVFLVSYII